MGNHEYTFYEMLKEKYNIPIVGRDLDDIYSHLRSFVDELEKLDKCFPDKIAETVRKDIVRNYISSEIKYDFDDSQEKLEKYIPGGLRNMITISYILQDGFQFVSITVPSYITSYQVEQLEKVNEELKQIVVALEDKYGDNYGKFLIGITLDNFNPITHEVDYFQSIRLNNDFDVEEDIAKGKVKDPIQTVINYMKENNRVNDNIRNALIKNEKQVSVLV